MNSDYLKIQKEKDLSNCLAYLDSLLFYCSCLNRLILNMSEMNLDYMKIYKTYLFDDSLSFLDLSKNILDFRDHLLEVRNQIIKEGVEKICKN